PSRTVDHRAFEWTDGAWRGTHLPSSILYEIHIGTFTPEGTFEAAIERLDHLVALGIDAVELMPVAQFPGNHGWGYDGVDLYAPHHGYGGPRGLKRLVDACHGRGLGVIVDVVYNHLGPDGNYLGRFGPYFTDRYGTPWGAAVNLDCSGSDEVRRFFIDNARMWLRDYHADGLRLDAVHAIVDTSALHFLEELSAAVASLARHLGRHLYLIAESDLNDPRPVWPREAGGYGLDAVWSDDFHHALHGALTGELHGYYQDYGSLSDVARALESAYVYEGQYSKYRERRHGRTSAGVPASRFLGYLQNHDQVGNRARGERTGHLISTDLLKVGAALVLTAPFVPMLFQGEEWAAASPFPYFCDHQDPELAAAVSEGRRREFEAFGWSAEEIFDPQDPDTFQQAKLNWAEIARSPHNEILAWHRALIDLRRRVPDLSNGGLGGTRAGADEATRTLLVERGSVAVAANFSEEPRRVAVRGGRRLLLASSDRVAIQGQKVTLPPESVAIVEA
ncbi:MAG: malto-oligosyltrehalose trehalohydrolase, partial [Actinomycetota bacterium]